MKHLSRFLLATLCFFSFTAMQAQDENNPWAIGIGVNAVDFYPVGEDAPQGDYFDEYFNASDHWNILPSVSKISVGRYLGAGFVLELAGTINRIDKFGDDSRDDLTYYGLDGAFQYSFRNAVSGPEGWFDPYLGVGGGYTWVDDIGAGTMNGKIGINFWVSDNIAINVESTYKHAFEDYLDSHFQHSAGVKIAFGGKDTDGDGIYDKDDACPDTPGLAEFNGCPDSDGDGIPDKDDKCPDIAGSAEMDGCPDSDGDGIADPDDDCPNVAGLAEFNGCPDTDGDGTPDKDDKCPDEAGPAENDGCPYQDRDNDGVLDKDDECPDVAGSKENNGCPEVSVEVIKQLNDYSKTILFDLNKSSIRKDSYEALESIADIMDEYPKTVFHIGGHTDSTGKDSYNMKLSKERAASVRKYLMNKEHISADRVTSEGYGETKPIATNKTAAGRQQNRRVEISLEKNKE